MGKRIKIGLLPLWNKYVYNNPKSIQYTFQVKPQKSVSALQKDKLATQKQNTDYIFPGQSLGVWKVHKTPFEWDYITSIFLKGLRSYFLCLWCLRPGAAVNSWGFPNKTCVKFKPEHEWQQRHTCGKSSRLPCHLFFFFSFIPLAFNIQLLHNI